jgi:hypothetical protein
VTAPQRGLMPPGHSTVAVTLDTYSHVTAAMHREAARVMDELLGP